MNIMEIKKSATSFILIELMNADVNVLMFLDQAQL